MSQYAEETLPAVQEEWLKQLKDMTVDEIGHGLEKWNEDWPPNIIEFKKACKPAARPALPCHQMYQSLPAPKRTDDDVDNGKQWVQRMREKLL